MHFSTVESSNSPCSLYQVNRSKVTLVIIDTHAPTHSSRLPATEIIAEESITLLIPSLKELKLLIASPTVLDAATLEKISSKLEVIIGKPMYPSQISRLLFELAFTDPEEIRLTAVERTRYMGYILSNLGCGKAELIEKIFAFYYGYSFEYFSERK
jgi:hypothetical protein